MQKAGPVRAVLVGLLLAFASGAPASDDERLTAKVGWLLLSVNTDAALDASDGELGTSISFEDDLGLDGSVSTLWAQLNWRVGHRETIELTYMDISRTNSRVLQRDITWGDEVYTVGARVAGSFGTRFTGLAYRNSFTRREDREYGWSFGLLGARVSTSLALDSTSLSASRSASLTAPVPLLGLFGEQRLNDRWSASAAIQYIDVAISGYEGAMTDLQLGLAYQLNEESRVGLSYYMNRFAVDAVARSDWNGSFRYDFSGPLLYADYRF
jgi:hypothetical protein